MVTERFENLGSEKVHYNSISKFQIPRVGGVKSQDSSSQESQSCKMKHRKVDLTPFLSLGYWELEESRVKTLHHMIPEVSKCEMLKYEIMKALYG
jgi:hypothetical protein